MSDTDSVALWLGALKAGRRDDAEGAWDRYVHRLVRMAGTRLPGPARGASDGARGDELHRLLVSAAARRALAALRGQTPRPRAAGHAPNQPAPSAQDVDETTLLSTEPTRDAVGQFADECQRLLHSFDDETLRRIALLTLEGHSSTAIAAALGTTPRTVERKRNVIRAIWEQDAR